MKSNRERDFAPLFQAFGAAVFAAQNLEGGLRTLLALTDLELQAQRKSRVRINLDSQNAYVKLGEVFEQVHLFEHLTDAERKLIQRGLNTRNFLVHSFWLQKELDFASPAGRKSILQDLNRRHGECQKARQIVESFIDQHLAKFGTSLDTLGEPIAEEWHSDDPIH